jgi:hypothetical protein
MPPRKGSKPAKNSAPPAALPMPQARTPTSSLARLAAPTPARSAHRDSKDAKAESKDSKAAAAPVVAAAIPAAALAAAAAPPAAVAVSDPSHLRAHRVSAASAAGSGSILQDLREAVGNSGGDAGEEDGDGEADGDAVSDAPPTARRLFDEAAAADDDDDEAETRDKPFKLSAIRLAPYVIQSVRQSGQSFCAYAESKPLRPRNKQEVINIAHCIDSFLAERLPADSEVLELMTRRFVGVLEADRHQNWAMADALSLKPSMGAPIPRAVELQLLMDANKLERASKYAHKTDATQNRREYSGGPLFERRSYAGAYSGGGGGAAPQTAYTQKFKKGTGKPFYSAKKKSAGRGAGATL